MEKIAFVFPGQGCQYIKMGKSLFEHHNLVKQTFQEADEVLGYHLSEICFEGSLSKLNKIDNLFPAILTIGVATFRLFMEQIGMKPQFCAGHSLGEYSALVCAGALEFSDALKIVHERGKLAYASVDHEIYGMSILDHLNVSAVEEQCAKLVKEGKEVWISCYNSDNQVSISGKKEDMRIIEDYVLNEGGQISPLFAYPPLHSPLMENMVTQFQEVLESYPYHDFRYPVISNSRGVPYSRDQAPSVTLLEQLVKPVQWENTMQYYRRFGITSVIEMGPKLMLTNFVEHMGNTIKGYCYGQKQVQKELADILWAGNNQKQVMPTVITKCLAASAATPNENWNEEEYQVGVIEPNTKLRTLWKENQESGSKPSIKQAEEALTYLRQIMRTKKISRKEQREWISQILDETGMTYSLRACLENGQDTK